MSSAGGPRAVGVSRWEPVLGDHFAALLASRGLDSRQSREVASSTRRILARCRPPVWGATGGHAQLVVGQVQSGKTLSFTSVIAAARDNGFPLVVVLAGTKNNLRQQTAARLVEDLQMAGDGDVPPWRCVETPGLSDLPEVRRTLTTWTTDKPRQFQQTTVLVVLKHSGRIRAAAELLQALSSDRTLSGFPCLIVDDEADQAGLNTKVRRNEESTTYQAIAAMRQACRNHTLVQYTATPQATLLVRLNDALSPEAVTVLEPGEDYVGGATLFAQENTSFLRTISRSDLSIALDPTSPGPPQSLVDAVAYFLVAVAVAIEKGRPRPLSMLIHPSATTDLHGTYDLWVRRLLERVALGLESGDPSAIDELTSTTFAKPFAELVAVGAHRREDGSAIEIAEVVASLTNRVPYLKVRVVNSAGGQELQASEWNTAPGWIVIGGNNLDRGFTVKNLAVTYMPRGPGVSNADTVQQRGRFFGYKRSYLPLLRGWLNEDTAQAYRDYVEHEEALQDELRRLDAGDLPLSSWRRVLFLDDSLRPTRHSVISLATADHHLRPGWVFTQLGLYAGDRLRGNARLLQRWREAIAAGEPCADDTRAHRNTRSEVPLASVLEVLEEWAAVGAEREALDALCLALPQVLGDTAATAVGLYLMDGGRARSRGLNARAAAQYASRISGAAPGMGTTSGSLRIAALRQGRGGGNGYPGDEHFTDPDTLTVQVHLVEPQLPGGVSLAVVPALTIHAPASYRGRVILQQSQS